MWYDGHREHMNEVTRAWAKNNHDHKREYEKEYHIKHPEKQKQYEINHRIHEITNSEWENCLHTYGYKCAYCGTTLKDHKNKFNQTLHKDHVDTDGYNDLSNAVPSCRSCNSAKHDLDMKEWFRRQIFFTEEKLEFIVWWIIEGYKNYIEEKPPYRVIRKRNEGLTTYHFELWTVDNMRNKILLIANSKNKKGLDNYIKEIEQSLG